MSDLPALLARLREANGLSPSERREIDGDIAEQFDLAPPESTGWKRGQDKWNRDEWYAIHSTYPYRAEPYLESVDAALALTEHKLPGKWWVILNGAWHRMLPDTPLADFPRYILIALLSAIAEKGDG